MANAIKTKVPARSNLGRVVPEEHRSAADNVAARKHYAALLTQEEEHQGVEEALCRLYDEVHVASDVEALLLQPEGRPSAIVCFGRDDLERIRAYLDELAPWIKDESLWVVPIIVVVGDVMRGRDLAEFYRHGAAALAAWPSEGVLLPRLIEASIKVRDARPVGFDASVASAMHVRILAGIDERFGEGIEVRMQDDAYLVGGIDQNDATMRKLVSEILSRMPGVGTWRFDETSSRKVLTSGEMDAEIRRRWTVHGLPRMALRVMGADAYLCGAVADRATMDRLVRVAASVPGIREVHNLLMVSPAEAKRLRAKEDAVQARLDTCNEVSNLDVQIIGKTAIIKGEAQSKAAREEAAKLARSVERVERVVNRLHLRGSELS